MDVKNGEKENQGNEDNRSIYILTDDDVENILVATDALYWTILQLVRGRDRVLQVNKPLRKNTHA